MEYEQGSSQALYATFADINGVQVAVLSGAVLIRHWSGGAQVNDKSEDMTAMSGSTYCYSWNIPPGADLGTYEVKYIGLYIDGTIAIGTEDIQVIPRKFYQHMGGGMIKTVTKRDTWAKKEKEDLLKKIDDLYSALSDGLGLGSRTDKENIDKITKLIMENNLRSEVIDKIMEFESAIVPKLDNLKLAMDSQPKQEVEVKLTGIQEISDLTGKIGKLSQDLYSVKSALSAIAEANRDPLIITQLDDLEHKMKELNTLLIKSLPGEAIEEVLSDMEDGEDAAERCLAK
jgi:archaellum component FlaC